MADPDATDIHASDELRLWRGRLGLTQKEAAVQLGIHLGTLKNIEGGKRGMSQGLRRLMAVLGSGQGLAGGETRKTSAIRAVPTPGVAERAGAVAFTDGDMELIELAGAYARASSDYISILLEGRSDEAAENEFRSLFTRMQETQSQGTENCSAPAKVVFATYVRIANTAWRALGAARAGREMPPSENASGVDGRKQGDAWDLLRAFPAIPEKPSEKVFVIEGIRQSK